MDSNGRMRIYLYGPTGAIVSYDENGKPRARMVSSIVAANDSNGQQRVVLNAPDNRIYFYNSSGGLVGTYPQ